MSANHPPLPQRTPFRHSPRAILVAALALGLASGAARAQVPDPNTWSTNGSVYAMAKAGNTIYIGGSFTSVSPNTGTWVGIDPASGAPRPGWPRVNGAVSCVAPDGLGGWYIGGAFTAVGGVDRAGLAHIRADLTLDSWNPGVLGNYGSNPVAALVVSGPTVYVGGYFYSAGGQNRSSLAALDATTGLATPWNPAANGSVYALAVSGSTVYAGGEFGNIGRQARGGLAALDANTGLATAWNPAANGSVYALAVSGSTVYAGGLFTGIGGQARGRVAALDAATGLATAWNPGANAAVLALAAAGPVIYVGGSFTSIGGQGRRCVAALDSTTGLAAAWNPDAGGSSYDPSVSALAVSGTTVYAGGSFTGIGGQARANLAALDASTGLATAWNPGANAAVAALSASGSTVCAGGSFTRACALGRSNLAALDATTGRPTAWDPGADGSVWALAASGSTVYAGGGFTSIGGQGLANLAALDATTGLATSWNPAANSSVIALAVSGSTVYAGGGFTSIGGQSRQYIAALDAASGLATAWNPGANSSVWALALDGPTVYAGGYFTGIGGQSRNFIAALDATSGAATAWNPVADSPVSTLALGPATVYAGGSFTHIGGQPRGSIAALSAATGLATGWNPAADGGVYALALNGSTLYAGGEFYTIGGETRGAIAALDVTSGLATAWDPGAGSYNASTVYALAASGPAVYAGGTFTYMGGQDYPGFAALRDDALAPTVTVLSPNGGTPLLIGAQRMLSWVASDDLAVQSVDLYLSRTGPSGPWTLLAAGAPNTGNYDWLVTGPAVAGANAYLRVQARDFSAHLGTDTSDGGVAITTSPLDAGPAGAIAAFALSPPAPNPTLGRSRLGYAVPSSARVRLSMLDVQGREVAVLADGQRAAGRYSASIDATGLRAGIYFARLQAQGVELVRRVVVVK